MKYIIILIGLTFLIVLDLLILHRILITIPLMVIFISTCCGICSHNFKNSNSKFKFVLISAFLMAVLIGVYFCGFEFNQKNMLEAQYQIPIFMLLISVFINVFSMFLIIFNLEFSSENHDFNKNDNNVDLVNPATGLLMKDGVDPLGNVFGQKQHNENDFK